MLTPQRSIDENVTYMIQSPCGSINTIAYNSFNTQVPLKRTFLEKDKHIQTQINIDNTDSSDQLLWTNPIRQSLNPHTLRQLANSNPLLDMAQSVKTPLGVNPFWKTGATPPIELI